MACLKDNKENVSDSCKQRMQQIRQSRKDGKRQSNPNGG